MTMASNAHLEFGGNAHLEFGGGVLARINLNAPRPENPMLPFVPKRLATPIGNHPIVGLFDANIRGRLEDIFSSADWSHITVCRLGFHGQGPAQCPATILVGVRPNTMNKSQAIELLCLAADLVYQLPELWDVAIEIIETDVAADASFRYKFEEAFCHQPLIGVGIALSDSTKVGTLGGYLKITTAAKSKYAALTCHHALTDDETAIFLPDKARPAVVCPPRNEMDDWKSDITEQIEQTETLPPFPLLRIKQEAGQLTGKEANMLHRMEETLNKARIQVTQIANFRNDFAELYCTSGLRLSDDRWILDWGLVELLQGRVQSFDNLSSALSWDAIMDIRSRERRAKALTVEGGIVSLDELAARTDLRENDTTHGDERAVFKCGRTTGKTCGELNRVHSSVRVRYNRGIIMKGKALVIVSPPQASQQWAWLGPGDQGVFGAPGDSGSLVFDYQGKVLGIYFAGQRYPDDSIVTPPITAPSVDGVHFVTPIAPIIDSIRATVQADPSFDGLPVDVEFLWGCSR